MICNEKGVLPNSEYFFFDPSRELREHYYCVLNCGHFYCQRGYRIRREGNTVPLFIYVIEGEFHLEYEGGRYLAKAGDIVLIEGQKPHYYYSGDYCEFIYIHYSGHCSTQLTNHLIEQNQRPLFQMDHHHQIYQLVKDPIAKLCCRQTVNDVELSCMVYNCLCHLQHYSAGLSLHSAVINHAIADSILFIRNHIKQDLTLKSLARQASLSPYYYAHLFKRETGMSPMEYIAGHKINIAKTMLKTTQQSISEIADSLGYSSSSSFINAFSSRVGISPLKFRNSKIS